MMVYLKD